MNHPHKPEDKKSVDGVGIAEAVGLVADVVVEGVCAAATCACDCADSTLEIASAIIEGLGDAMS